MLLPLLDPFLALLLGLTTAVVGSYSTGLLTEDPTYFLFYDYVDVGETTADDLPEHFDWRSKGIFPPIREQAGCGACSAFAFVAGVEASLAIACGKTFNLSEQFVFSCGNGDCDEGMYLADAEYVIEEQGIPDEACMPYRGVAEEPCSTACGDLTKRVIKGVKISYPTDGVIDVVTIKRAIQKAPVVTSMILFDDLHEHRDGVYWHEFGDNTGRHAILLIGWDDDDEAWIARNSWGTNWGEKGYFKVAWRDVSVPGRYTYAFDVSQAVVNEACSKF